MVMRRGWVFALALLVPSLAHAGDPKTECISAADQAQQARDDGKWRAARDGFVSCSRAVCPKMVSASCTKWAREIEDGMPTVVLAAKDASGADLTDVRVTFDGATLATVLDGKPVDVDPGAHKFRFSRDGSEPAEQTVVVKAGEKLRAVSVVMQPSSAVVTHTEPVQPIIEHPRGPGDGAHIATTVVLGVLAAGALAGGVAMALSSQSDADTAAGLRAPMPANACFGANGSSASCQSLSSAVDAQNRDAAIAITMYVVSGLFAAGAVIAFIAWPKHKTESAAHLFIGPGSFGIGGTF
jgi:hypothetical protein